MLKKTLLKSIDIIYWTKLTEIHTNLSSLILGILLFLFFKFATEHLQHSLENNPLLYSL